MKHLFINFNWLIPAIYNTSDSVNGNSYNRRSWCGVVIINCGIVCKTLLIKTSWDCTIISNQLYTNLTRLSMSPMVVRLLFGLWVFLITKVRPMRIISAFWKGDGTLPSLKTSKFWTSLANCFWKGMDFLYPCPDDRFVLVLPCAFWFPLTMKPISPISALK
jgi:hypothetical protein